MRVVIERSGIAEPFGYILDRDPRGGSVRRHAAKDLRAPPEAPVRLADLRSRPPRYSNEDVHPGISNTGDGGGSPSGPGGLYARAVADPGSIPDWLTRTRE